MTMMTASINVFYSTFITLVVLRIHRLPKISVKKITVSRGRLTA